MNTPESPEERKGEVPAIFEANLKASNRLYHTRGSAIRTLKNLPDESGEIALLQQAIKQGGFDYQELDGTTVESLDIMERLLIAMLDQIKTMAEMLPVREIRRSIAEKLLFLKAILAIPLIPFKDPEDALYMPEVTLLSIDIEMQLEAMLMQVKTKKQEASKNTK